MDWSDVVRDLFLVLRPHRDHLPLSVPDDSAKTSDEVNLVTIRGQSELLALSPQGDLTQHPQLPNLSSIMFPGFECLNVLSALPLVPILCLVISVNKLLLGCLLFHILCLE